MGPSEICNERLHTRLGEHTRLKARHRRLGTLRLVCVGLGLAALWWIETYAPAFTWPTVGGLVAAFIASTLAFSKLEADMRYCAHAAMLYADPVLGERQRRTSKGQTVEALDLPEDHPFARDVDVFEVGGLFDFLTLATTRAGMHSLMKMLTDPVGATEIRERQAAVKELKPQMDLREQFYVAGSQKLPFVRTDQMLKWAEAEAPKVPLLLSPLCNVLGAGACIAAVFFAANPTLPTLVPLAAILLAEFVIWRVVKGLKIPSLEAELVHLDFRELRGLLRILEGQDFHAEQLRELVAALRTDGISATKRIARFCRLISLFEARRKPVRCTARTSRDVPEPVGAGNGAVARGQPRSLARMDSLGR